MEILLLFVLNIYAGLSGLKDAILYSRQGADAHRGNEHVLFTLERAIVVLIAIVSTQTSLWEALGATLAFVLTFSFVHNSAYYLGRSIIGKTKFQWTYSSTTSTAKLEFGFPARLVMFILGLILLLVQTILW